MLNAAILFVALYYFLYKPVRKYMHGRADKIQKQLDDARDAQQRASDALSQSQQALKGAERKASDTVAVGAQQAQRQADDIIAAAKRDAERIRQQAKKDADAMVDATRASMVDEAAARWLLKSPASSSPARSKLDDHRRLVDEFRAKVG